MTQQRIFRAMQKGYMTPKEIAAHLKLSHMAVYHALRRMTDSGYAQRVPLHYTVAPGVECPPDDMRGMHPNSQKGLLREHPGKKLKAPRRPPKAGIELERCWGNGATKSKERTWI